MHIGLIGGIGPAATIAYYNRLISAFKSAQMPLQLTIVHADVAALASNATNKQNQTQAEIFAKHIRQLEGAGCDVAAITALTGHFCFSETQQISALPLVSAIAPIDRYCVESGITTIGLLGSPPVLATHLFQQLENVNTVVPQDDIDQLGAAYMNMATTGICTNEMRTLFFDAGTKMIEQQNADAVLLAGTDLGLAFDGHTPGFATIDALDVHVAKLVSLTTGQ